MVTCREERRIIPWGRRVKWTIASHSPTHTEHANDSPQHTIMPRWPFHTWAAIEDGRRGWEGEIRHLGVTDHKRSLPSVFNISLHVPPWCPLISISRWHDALQSRTARLTSQAGPTSLAPVLRPQRSLNLHPVLPLPRARVFFTQPKNLPLPLPSRPPGELAPSAPLD